MSVALIDYGSGNLRSAAKAIERAIAEAGRADKVLVTADPDIVCKADRIVLPGVGAFADCMAGVTEIAGMRDALEESVLKRGKPFLGICVGMQLLAERGLEYGTHPGLGWIKGDVVALTPSDPALKVPHMGWNQLDFTPGRHALLNGLEPGCHAYFVHSYHLRASEPADVLATTEYGGTLAALVGRDNIAGTQFHPEKSQQTGLRLLANFLDWTP